MEGQQQAAGIATQRQETLLLTHEHEEKSKRKWRKDISCESPPPFTHFFQKSLRLLSPFK